MTNSSKERPTVLIDVDGVLRDFIGSLIEVYLKQYPDHVVKPVTSRRLEDFFPIGKDIYDLMDETHVHEILVNAPVFDGAAEALRQHIRAYRIEIATAQPEMGRAPTLIWLAKNNIALNSVHISHEKERLAGIALLDDFVENLEAFAATGRLAVCMDQPWNQDWLGPRVSTVGEFFALVRDEVENPPGGFGGALLA